VLMVLFILDYSRNGHGRSAQRRPLQRSYRSNVRAITNRCTWLVPS